MARGLAGWKDSVIFAQFSLSERLGLDHGEQENIANSPFLEWFPSQIMWIGLEKSRRMGANWRGFAEGLHPK